MAYSQTRNALIRAHARRGCWITGEVPTGVDGNLEGVAELQKLVVALAKSSGLLDFALLTPDDSEERERNSAP